MMEYKDDWQRHFKNIIKCLRCEQDYGSDRKNDNGICPACCNIIWTGGKKKKLIEDDDNENQRVKHTEDTSSI